MIKNDLIQHLSIVLADTYTLYLKTQNYHWHVKGKEFYSLHLLFEKQYEDLAEAIDTIAERIRALGHQAPATFKEFLELTHLKEGRQNISSTEMLKELAEDQLTIAKSLKEAIKIGDATGDDATVDMLIERADHHDKNRWMLESSIG